ncbi:TetR family transcriptional regulator [Actinophytocola oryzae]|uniref:TetR family transcriptional regulator n=1 Tax=Actinophytocola oryzae TaxID=502181 RepID=A0A4R7UUH1_9PSEU|nr:TetR family transcriptional regulator [Actinophytocola oryzae]TDV40090.1 TetR family transcriptional regulator [Actinophytocola oryzae]
MAVQSGVSRGLITYYFRDKQQLAHELLARYLDGIAVLTNVTGTPDERLAAIIAAHCSPWTRASRSSAWSSA